MPSWSKPASRAPRRPARARPCARARRRTRDGCPTRRPRRGALARAHAPDQGVQPVPGGFRHPTRAARVSRRAVSRERSVFPRASQKLRPMRHRLAHRLHLRRQRAVGARELLEREAGRLHDDVVDRRLERGRRRARDVVRDLVERVADGECASPPSRSGSPSPSTRAPSCATPAGSSRSRRARPCRVERELHVRAAGLHSHSRMTAAPRRAALVLAVGERHRRRDGDRVAGVDAHRIDVLDRADDDDVVARSRITSSSNSFQPSTLSSMQHLRDRASRSPRATSRRTRPRRARTRRLPRRA